ARRGRTRRPSVRSKNPSRIYFSSEPCCLVHSGHIHSISGNGTAFSSQSELRCSQHLDEGGESSLLRAEEVRRDCRGQQRRILFNFSLSRRPVFLERIRKCFDD